MRKIISYILCLALVALVVAPVQAAKPADVGFNEFGYNYQARLFQGRADGVDKLLDDEVWGDPAYANDHLVMRWSKAWDDARFNGADWTCDAWENNEWNGKTDGGSGEVWHYKIVWVGPQTWDVTGPYEMDVLFLGGNYGYDLTLNQSGNVVTGDLYDPYLPGNLTIFDGTINGNAIVFKVDYGSGSVQGIRTFTGTIDTFGLLSGSWSESGTENGSDTWSTTSGAALLTEGPYWVDGGTRIWEQFETIMDHGVDPNVGPGHIWLIHAIPNGYGSVK